MSQEPHGTLESPAVRRGNELLLLAQLNPALRNSDRVAAWSLKMESGNAVAAEAAGPASRHSNWAEYSRAWRDRQPRRGRREDWIWGHPSYTRRISRSRIRDILKEAHKLNRAQRRSGQTHGPLGSKGVDVLAALLVCQFKHNGRCHPSYKEIARRARCSTNTVHRALIALAAAGLIQAVPRRRIGRRRDGLVAPLVTSNAYLFPTEAAAEASPDRDNRGGIRTTNLKACFGGRHRLRRAASAWSADLRSPAATAYVLEEHEIPF